MSNYSHRGYEHRTGGYGRRRHKASGFKRKSAGSAAAKTAVGVAAAVAVVALVYLFADNIAPFVDSFRKDAHTETQDVPAAASVMTEDKPEVREEPHANGSFDPVNGDVFVSNGAGYLKFKGIDTTARNYAAVLNSVSASMSEKVNIYSAVIPTNTEFGLVGRLDGSNSQLENLNMIDSLLSDRVKSCDIYSALFGHENEYIYFRTDECMTSLGAYYAYKEIAETAGIHESAVYTLDKLSQKKGSISPFEGSFIEMTTDERTQPHGNQELFDNADTIEFYKLPVHYDCYSVDPSTGSRRETDLFDERKAASDPISIFPGKDTALLNIYDLQSSNTDKLLIVKDHDAEPVIGYLIPHFAEIYVADVSLYKGNLREYANEHEINNVIFISGIADANNSLYCQRLRDLFDNSISDQ